MLLYSINSAVLSEENIRIDAVHKIMRLFLRPIADRAHKSPAK
jgi:hypothetical protein